MSATLKFVSTTAMTLAASAALAGEPAAGPATSEPPCRDCAEVARRVARAEVAGLLAALEAARAQASGQLSPADRAEESVRQREELEAIWTRW